MADSITYVVQGMTCDHCKLSVTEELAGVPGVDSIDVDLPTGRVTVIGMDVDEAAVRAAVAEAGYRLAP